MLPKDISAYLPSKIDLFSSKCTSSNSLKGKTVIVTGSNTGMGKEAARDFAKRGARVILACRNYKKGKEAAEDIKKDGPYNVVVRLVDLTSFKSIRQFAYHITESEESVDILVNNAGILSPKGRTEDDIDLVFGTNHLGPFLLTNLLLRKMKQSTSARIVNVSSAAHLVGSIDWDDINLDKKFNYNQWKAYTQSKLCNILFTRELANKLSDSKINVYAVNPGFVNTDLLRNMPYLLRPLVAFVMPFISKNVVAGAQTTIHCAVSDDVEKETGLYYSECKLATPSALAKNEFAAKRLWEISSDMSGLKALLTVPKPKNSPGGLCAYGIGNVS